MCATLKQKAKKKKERENIRVNLKEKKNILLIGRGKKKGIKKEKCFNLSYPIRN
jgi:glucosamine 6-phosphate synthetase-like amidotransferase/phosphosugar isomerase protein